MKKAKIYMHKIWAGTLIEDYEGFHFTYEKEYLTMDNPEPISLTLPLTSLKYSSKILFPFFDGLIPEGWLLDIAEKNWKFNMRDRMSILLATCKDCIGPVSVEPIQSNEDE